nr:type IV toxin-antitoxin system AbiEi family antitoxin domain-containing protein [Angustibacter aerolatus]
MQPPMTQRAHGLFTTADASRAGYSPQEIARRVRRGDWVRLRRGAFVTGDVHRTATTPSVIGCAPWP